MGMITHYPLLAARPHDTQSLDTSLEGFKGVAPADKALLMNIGSCSYSSGMRLPLSHLFARTCKRTNCLNTCYGSVKGSENLLKQLAHI